jgi:hypothetical protein
MVSAVLRGAPLGLYLNFYASSVSTMFLLCAFCVLRGEGDFSRCRCPTFAPRFSALTWVRMFRVLRASVVNTHLPRPKLPQQPLPIAQRLPAMREAQLQKHLIRADLFARCDVLTNLV